MQPLGAPIQDVPEEHAMGPLGQTCCGVDFEASSREWRANKVRKGGLWNYKRQIGDQVFVRVSSVPWLLRGVTMRQRKPKRRLIVDRGEVVDPHPTLSIIISSPCIIDLLQVDCHKDICESCNNIAQLRPEIAQGRSRTSQRQQKEKCTEERRQES